jgi:hypothetical protein
LIVDREFKDIYDGNWTVITSDVTRLIFIVNWSVASLIEFTVVVEGINMTFDNEFGVIVFKVVVQLDIGLPLY